MGNLTKNKTVTVKEVTKIPFPPSFEEIPTEISGQERLKASHGGGGLILQE